MSADPILLFDRLGPPDGWSAYTDVATDQIAADILAGVFADGNVVSLDARRRRRRGIGPAVVVASLVAGGAVAALLNRSPEETRRVTCYSEAAVQPDARAELLWDGRSDPVDLCATEWANGTLSEKPPTPPFELTPCVAENGAVAVVPGGSDICDALGLASYRDPTDESLLAVRDAQRELDEIFLVEENCVPPAAAEEEIERVLAKYELSGWTIKIVLAYSENEPCATAVLEPDQTVSVSFVPRHR